MTEEPRRAAPPRALIVDDEPQILMIMQFALETAGFAIVTANDGARAWELFSCGDFDVVVLDLMIPSVGGLALTERIRAVSDVPIMMITALSEESDRVRGLQIGADDYMTKPFSPREFALRAQALVRRWRGRPTTSIVNGALTVDIVRHRVLLDGRLIEMPATETHFLEALALHMGRSVSYRDLLNQVWATHETNGGKDMIKMTAYRVRQALGDEGRTYVRSLRGVGYTMPILPQER
ncbi:response regulator transcription factor [Actinomyces sp. B33]|uniref:response regulator transcription factor n=1 Tax=Actinomyces sp. B33 TaxID=2942131 RepID=UPI002340CCDF|nr:response regulator transcription factor [Actinomyces sp. B33]MDC4233806.1 response regulator transcription factor [Actinomyces sp. B33]